MFGTLPPEVISTQIYTGPGAGPLTQASQAWTNLAAEWEANSLQVKGIISGVGDIWTGPSAAAMTASAGQLVAWMESTAGAARQSALAASAAVSAYEQALAAVVPPTAIATNRAQLLMLIATNLLGQNTSAIAATEAQYEAMWAQDIAAMTAYQGSSSAATTQLPTFTAAPQVATPLAAAAQPAAGLLGPGGLLDNSTTVGQLIQAVVSSGAPIDIVALFTSFFGPFLGASEVAGQVAAQNAIIASKPSAPQVVYPPSTPPAPKPEVKAQAGGSNRIGPMRVPPSWAQPPSVASPATPLPPAGGKDRDHAIGLPVIPAVPLTAVGKKKRSGYSDPDDMHYGAPSPTVLPRHPSGG